ncbi:MAG: MFS transporter [Tepidisphaeraceae bacterium]
MDDKAQPIPPPPDQPIYEPPDADRPASAAPTEQQLAFETPTLAALDYSPPPPEHDPYAALRLPIYRLYAVSFMLAIIGGQVQTVAVAWQIYQKTQSALSLGFIGGIQVIPLFLLALPAGHLSDTISRKRILLVTQWLLAFWGVALAWLTHYHSGWPMIVPAMYGLILLNAVTLTFARPARSALLPSLVPSAAFSNAVTWNSSMFEVASMVGPAIGGAIVAAGGASSAYLLNAILLVGCALMTARLPDTPAQRREGEAPGFKSLLAGVSFVFSRRLMLATMTLDLFAVLLGGAVYLLPVFAKDILHVGAGGFGWLRAAPSIGAFSMAIIIAHRPPMRRAGRALLLAVIGFGLATLVFGLTKNFLLSFSMLVLIGAFDNISVVVRHTLVQLLTPDAMRGRVSAVNQIFIGSSNELGGLESGVTAAWWGPVGSVVFGAIGTLVTVITVGWFSPELRKFGRLDQASVDASSEAGSHGDIETQRRSRQATPHA